MIAAKSPRNSSCNHTAVDLDCGLGCTPALPVTRSAAALAVCGLWRYKRACTVADPKILKGVGEDNLAVPSSFIANANNGLYAFYTEKGGFLSRHWCCTFTFTLSEAFLMVVIAPPPPHRARTTYSLKRFVNSFSKVSVVSMSLRALQDGYAAARRFRQRKLARGGGLERPGRQASLRRPMQLPRRARIPRVAPSAGVDQRRRADGVLPSPKPQRREAAVVAVPVVRRTAHPCSTSVEVRRGGGQRRRPDGPRARGAPLERDPGHEPTAAGGRSRGPRSGPRRRLVAGDVLPHGRRRGRRRHHRRQGAHGAEAPRETLRSERRVNLGRVPRTAAGGGGAVRRRRVAVPGRRVETVGGVVERLAVVQEPGELVMRRRAEAACTLERHVKVPLLLAPLCSSVFKPDLRTRTHTHAFYHYPTVAHRAASRTRVLK